MYVFIGLNSEYGIAALTNACVGNAFSNAPLEKARTAIAAENTVMFPIRFISTDHAKYGGRQSSPHSGQSSVLEKFKLAISSDT